MEVQFEKFGRKEYANVNRRENDKERTDSVAFQSVAR